MSSIQIIKDNDTSIKVFSCGKGQAVLFLHGGYSGSEIWEEALDRISEQYMTLRYDQRGYGQSEPAVKPFSHAETLKAVLDGLELKRVHLIGSSFGGAVAIDFSLQYPEYVDRLVLVGPSVNGMNIPFRMKLEGILDYMRVRRSGMDKAVEKLLRKKFWRYLIPQTETRRQRFRELYLGNESFYTGNPSLQKPLEPNAVMRLKEIDNKTLVIEPERDHVFNRKACRVVHENIPNAKKIVMSGCGHYPHLEQPEVFSKIVLEFLNQS
ncbi:alpha/beta fold hydrolase [Marinicrinis lubricantis]